MLTSQEKRGSASAASLGVATPRSSSDAIRPRGNGTPKLEVGLKLHMIN